MKLKTVRIKHLGSDKHWLTINQVDYDANVHQLWESASKPQSEATLNAGDSAAKLYSEEELLDLPWQTIKSIATQLGIEKPEGGWDEALPLILEAQRSQFDA